MIDLLITVAALGVWFVILYFCLVIAREESVLVGVAGLIVVTALGLALILYFYQESQVEHPAYSLDQRYWKCGAEHPETSTTYVMSGKVMIPITTTSSVCDAYMRK